jgi:hypothetical protein
MSIVDKVADVQAQLTAQIRGLGLALMLTAVLTIPAFAAIVLSAPAKADPADNYIAHYAPTMCEFLDRNQSLNGIVQLGDAIYADGFGDSAGRILVDSIVGYCPRHTGLLESFIAVYAPPQHNTMVAAGRMGGTIQ